jgi:hypothetical protein
VYIKGLSPLLLLLLFFFVEQSSSLAATTRTHMQEGFVIPAPRAEVFSPSVSILVMIPPHMYYAAQKKRSALLELLSAQKPATESLRTRRSIDAWVYMLAGRSWTRSGAI